MPAHEHENRADHERTDALTARDLAKRHLTFGWALLLLFLTLGLALELLHGFKVSWYLDVGQETRRLMWTLAHAHGALLALVNVAFAWTVIRLAGWSATSRGRASRTLQAATILLPGGFFAGGVWIHGGDPGLGILLVPLGGLLLFISVLLTALAARRG